MVHREVTSFKTASLNESNVARPVRSFRRWFAYCLQVYLPFGCREAFAARLTI